MKNLIITDVQNNEAGAGMAALATGATIPTLYANAQALTTLDPQKLYVNAYAVFTYTATKKDGSEYDGEACLVFTEQGIYKTTSRIFINTLKIGSYYLTISSYTPNGSKYEVKTPRLEELYKK